MIVGASVKKYRSRGGEMKYPIAIELGGDDAAWGVIVPDLPGCFSAADGGFDQAIEKAKEAIKLWIEFAIYCNEEIPAPSELKVMQQRKEFKGMHWALVDPES
jgi:predicted RNase H-like HicB family nuclease